MHSLLYRSTSRPGLLASDLNAIVDEATSRNASLGVTGLLLHGQLETVASAPGEFVQWLEGPEDAVESLYASIARDPRHADLEVLGRGPLTSGLEDGDGRLFPRWSMGLVRMSELPATLDGFLRFANSWDGALEAA